MTAEINKAIIRRIVEEIQNRDNLALIDELLAPNFVACDQESAGAHEQRRNNGNGPVTFELTHRHAA
jgi:hypothetical protein